MEDRKFLFISLVVSFILIFGAVLFLSKNNSSPKIVDAAILIGDGRHLKGKEGAKVIIAEFSDLQCPACKLAEAELSKIYDVYKDRVKFVYRDYPLTTVHKYSERAAEASEFASENGKFWEFHDLMFAKQEEWSAASNQDAFDVLISGYAKSLGLDDKKMIEALNNKVYSNKVQGDVGDGNKAGISATPTFFVNGEETNGYSFEEFKRLIEENLNKE